MKRRDRIAYLAPTPGTATLNASELPNRITLLRRGRNETAQGPFIVNARTDSAIAAQVSGGIYDRVLLDFQHNSEPHHPNYQQPPRHHAAVGRPFCGPEGLGMEALEWTPKGREHAGDYPDLSPAVVFDRQTREVLALTSAALCAQGATINGIAFFEADATPNQGRDGSPQPSANKEQTMPDTTELITRINALASRLDAVEAKLNKTEADVKEEIKEVKEEVKEEVAAAVTAATDAKTAVDALSADSLKIRKQAITDAAKRAGKTLHLSETAIAALSIEDLQAHVDALPKGRVPMQPQTSTGEGHTTLSAAQLIEQYNSITDPTERGEFYKLHASTMGL